jgi:IS30 family transposase
MAEREEISRGVAAGESCRQIAARLGRAPSTVSRELARNSGRGCYRAQAADAAAFCRAQRPKPAKLLMQPRLRAVVEAKLGLRWSPEQIAGWLPLAYPSDPVMRVSHETIYLSLFVQSRGALRRELQRCLRTGGRCATRRASACPRAVASSAHTRFTVDTGVQVYFCDPRSPWQRGSNENTNGLLRQYLSRGADLRQLDQADLDAIAAELNGRPRQTLGFKTPSQALAEALP